MSAHNSLSELYWNLLVELNLTEHPKPTVKPALSRPPNWRQRFMQNAPREEIGSTPKVVAISNQMSEFARFVQDARTTEQQMGSDDRRPETLRAWLDLAEAYRITQALRECNGNRSAAARLLGIGRRTLYAKMDKLNITPSWRMT